MLNTIIFLNFKMLAQVFTVIFLQAYSAAKYQQMSAIANYACIANTIKYILNNQAC